jgi:dienelactone hydrolase
MSLLAIAATGLAGLLSPILGPSQPAQTPPLSPQAPAIESPAGAIKGTMVIVHGGGWAGSAPTTQKKLLVMPGETFRARGWRTVSVDYHGGSDGLDDVMDATRAELAQPTGGLLCLYGESAGGQLALVTAARVPGVDCVIGFAPPDDFETYVSEVAASHDPDRTLVSNALVGAWGQTPDARSGNDPIKLVSQITSDVLLLREDDDPLIPIAQIDNFVAARPTTQRVDLQSTAGFDLNQFYLHGTMSETGLSQYRAAIGSFVDRAAASYQAEREATRTGCKGVTRSLSQGGTTRLQSALRCLARNDAKARKAGARRAKTTSRRLRGELNAARAWGLLRASMSGRRALAALAAGRASTTVRSGSPTTVTLRVRR